jgi:uncharacterized membrane protein required for colicin V production
MLTAVTIIVILIVGYAHMRDGLFTAFCNLVNVLLAGIVAFGFWEPVADWLDNALQGGFWAGYEDFIALTLIFTASLIALRMITNRLAPDMLGFSGNVQYGGAIFGLITGYLLAGFFLCALQTLPWHEQFLGFEPRVSNDTGPRTVFPPDRVWLAMMRHAGAYPLAWREDSSGGETNYDRYRTFDRYGTFELRYLRYRRFNDNRPALKYQLEFERELYR